MEKVTFDGATKEQIKWGSNDDPNKVLTVGQEYTIEKWKVHSWHTKVKLEGVDGWFNSVSFTALHP